MTGLSAEDIVNLALKNVGRGISIPEGYVLGLSRRQVRRVDGVVRYPNYAHLYKGTYADVGQPMCARGYEKEGDISIWRGNGGEKGVCKVCLRRAFAGLKPAPWPRVNDEG